jgi:hypothetical protein
MAKIVVPDGTNDIPVGTVVGLYKLNPVDP